MILFVDDEPGAMRPWITELRAALDGCEVVVAAGVAEALKVAELKRGAVEVVVMDLQMPVDGPIEAERADFGQLTGIPLRDVLREKLPDVPAVFLTNRLDEPLLAALRGKGDLAYRKRNQRPKELVNTIRSLRSRSPDGSRRAAGASHTTSAPR